MKRITTTTYQWESDLQGEGSRIFLRVIKSSDSSRFRVVMHSISADKPGVEYVGVIPEDLRAIRDLLDEVLDDCRREGSIPLGDIHEHRRGH